MATTSDPATATSAGPGIQDGYPVEVVIALLVLGGLLYLGERAHKIEAMRPATSVVRPVPRTRNALHATRGQPAGSAPAVKRGL